MRSMTSNSWIVVPIANAFSEPPVSPSVLLRVVWLASPNGTAPSDDISVYQRHCAARPIVISGSSQRHVKTRRSLDDKWPGNYSAALSATIRPELTLAPQAPDAEGRLCI